MQLLSGKVEAFVKKHHQLVVFAGAFIVFMTFIVKEGLGEKWTRNAEVLDTAQYMYSLSALQSDSGVKLSKALHRLDLLEASTSPEKKKEAESHPGARLIDYANSEPQVAALENLVTNTLILVERLPELKSMGKECERYRDEIKAGRRELELFNAYTLDLNGLFQQHEGWVYTPKHPRNTYKILALLPPDLEAKQPLMFQRLNADYDNFVMLSRDLHEFNRGVLDEAKVIRERDEGRSNVAWWVSAFLFAIGWGLGLLGKVYGIPSAGGGD
jgi:hypothetical protein